jgi:hypothetical protein
LAAGVVAEGPIPTGESESIRRIRSQLLRLAPLETTVLLTGETGVGKGLCARALHHLSGRAGELVHVDCAALAPTLLESELFGHERGAFTGAVGRRLGRLERAAGGTLFLDEIGELEPAQQARLLGVLQERRFERVGGSRALPLQARIVAATGRDLVGEVRRGRFRADLYYRIAVVQIELPPLRTRRGDVPLLAREGLVGISRRLGLPPPRLDGSALAMLAAHGWRGNVRELFNALERLAIQCPGDRVGPAELERVLPADAGSTRRTAATSARDEHARIAAALDDAGGNVAGAARLLGLPRTTLRRRLARLDAAPRSAAEQRRQLQDHQPQRDQREHALVEPREPDLGHAPEDAAAHPGPGHHGGGEHQQRRQVPEEGEARHAEHGELRQVTERLTGRLRADDALAVEPEVEEEGCEQRTGGADGGIEQADHATQHDEAPPAIAALRVQPRRQRSGDPGREQHEAADQRARQ